MKKSHILAILLLSFSLVGCYVNSVKVEQYAIIPEPVMLTYGDGSFTIDNHTKMVFDNLAQNSETSKYISKTMRQLRLHASMGNVGSENSIVFRLLDTVDDRLGDEGYALSVTNDGIRISANTEAGLFYGFQTFIQMLPDDIHTQRYKRITLTGCSIVDYPRFAWRGSHLDVSRHFFTVKDIKKHLDLMATYKLNKFHWHLTDDHGWRIEIEKYPNLNDIGSWRVDRSDVPWGDAEPEHPGEERSYGGFYSKSEIAEVVAYAAARHIDVVPEIEIPGHCAAVLASYPEFGCANDDTTYQVQIGPYWPPRAILCGGNDSVLQFLRDVMDEIIPLFPYKVYHIGGDEAVKYNWERCPRCQARIKALHLAGEEGLQGWMIQEIERYLQRQGKQIIGWDEILLGDISDSAIVMSWQGSQGAVKAAQHGNYAVMTPTDYCYFDYYQGDTAYCPPAMPHLLPLYKVYQFNPIPSSLTQAQARYILGGQCNLWTEYINTYNHAEYMLLPRLCAMSECLWSPLERKDWTHFRAKVAHHKVRLGSMGYTVFDGYYRPIVTTSRTTDGLLSVTLDGEVEGMQIYYSTTGSPEKGQGGILYTEPFTVKPNTVVQTASYLNDTLKERIYRFTIDR